MTQEEFDSIDWIGQVHAVIFDGLIYHVAAIDTAEYLIGIIEDEDDDEISYKRCENCKLL